MPKGRVFDNSAKRHDSTKSDLDSFFKNNDIGSLFTKNDINQLFTRNNLGT